MSTPTFVQRITTTFSTPFYVSSSAPAADVPGLFPVSIDGHPYLVDTSFKPYRRDAFRHRSIPSKRDAADFENIPGENSVNTQGLWRREQIDWSHGSGQLFFDRKGSDPSRFRRSKGIYPWQPWQASLLNDTQQILPSTNTNLKVVTTTSGYLYAIDGQVLKYTTAIGNPSTWTTVTGTPGATATDICTDGYNVYAAYGGSGVYLTTAGASSASHFVTSGTVNVIRYANGRLMAADTTGIYNITSTSPAALPSALYTHPNPGWQWVDFCEGSAMIYCAGFAGDVSLVYRTAILSDGTALTEPILAGALLAGEQVYSLGAYLNFVFIGTSLGVRFCQTLSAYDPTGNQGDLRMGSIIPTLIEPVGFPVRCMMGHNRWVWFGWSNYDANSTGLGRMDLTVFNGALTPAYCSDAMSPYGLTTQGEITSVCWFGGGPVFTISGTGAYGPSPNLVLNGNLYSGNITFGIPDKKIAMFLDVNYTQPLSGSVSGALAGDGSASQSLGTITASSPHIPLPISQVRAEIFEVNDTLTSNGTTAGPTLQRHTLKALPAIVSGTTISLVVILTERIVVDGQERYVDVDAELAFLESLRQSQKVVVYQEGYTSYQVTVDEIDYLPELPKGDQDYGYQADCVIYLKTLSG